MYTGIGERRSKLEIIDTAGSSFDLPSGNIVAYLATPYTKCADIDRAFQQAAKIGAALNKAGLTIFSPIAHSHPFVRALGLDHRDPDAYARLNKIMLGVCHVLIVVHLEGWQESDGIREEVDFFEKMHKPIYDCDPQTLVMKRRQ